MIIFCEECGERYIIEAEEIKNSSMIFICRVCNDIIHIPAQDVPDKQVGNKQAEVEKN